MTLPRSLTWEYLLPEDATFVGPSLPDGLDPRGYQGTTSQGQRYLLAHGSTGDAIARLDSYAGLIGLNYSNLSSRDLRSAGFTSIQRFMVIPSLENARLFIPISGGRAARASFELVRPRVSWKDRLELRLAKQLAGAGLLRAIPGGDRLVIAQRSAGPLESSVLEALPRRPIHLALTSGGTFPDERRKPAVAVLGRDGHVLAFGNLADAESPRALLQHKSGVLRELEARFGTEWPGPRLLQAAEAGRAYFTLQTAIHGHACGVELTPNHHAFLAKLAGGDPRKPAETHLMKTLDASLPANGPERDAFRLAAGLLADCRFEQTVQHGDFQPENLRATSAGVVAFDWEYGDLDGLPLFDAVYHVVHTSLVNLRHSVDQTLLRLRAFYREQLHSYGYSDGQMRAITMICALAFGSRLIGEENVDGSLRAQLTILATRLGVEG